MTDRSTDFLKDIYKDISKDSTVVRTNISTERLEHLISEHERIIMLGHGSPNGLFGMSGGGYVINDRNAYLLRGKDNIYIWCYASDFVKRHQLNGFTTGMFISEVGEAAYCGIDNFVMPPQEEVDWSNSEFAHLVGEQINNNIRSLYLNVKENYTPEILDNSAVVRYNWSRLELLNYETQEVNRRTEPRPAATHAASKKRAVRSSGTSTSGGVRVDREPTDTYTR